MRFEQVLERTYYDKGIFNVKVEHDRLIRDSSGPIAIQIGIRGRVISGQVDRRANQNGTARIIGRAALRDWFRQGFAPLDTILVEVVNPDHIVLTFKT